MLLKHQIYSEDQLPIINLQKYSHKGKIVKKRTCIVLNSLVDSTTLSLCCMLITTLNLYLYIIDYFNSHLNSFLWLHRREEERWWKLL